MEAQTLCNALVQGSWQAWVLGMRDDLSTHAGLDLNPSLTLPLAVLTMAGRVWVPLLSPTSVCTGMNVGELACDPHTQGRTEWDFGVSGLEDPAFDKVSTLPLTVNPA